MKEVFKSYPDFLIPWTKMPMYTISNLWKIKSHKFSSTYIVPTNINNGWYEYFQFVLFKKRYSFTVHRMVMLSHIWPCPEGLEVNHLNWIKTDNRLENLEYTTRQKNMKHAIATWLRKPIKGSAHHFFWKTWKSHPKSHTLIQKDMNWEFVKEWGSVSLAAKTLGVSKWYLNNVANKRDFAYWFLWEKA